MLTPALVQFLDFATLPKYHTSFYQSIEIQNQGGSPGPGDRLVCTIDNIPYPAIVEVNTAGEFTWRGYFVWNWIFNGLHSFKFEPLDDHGTRTRFVQCEELGGLLAGLLSLVGRQRMLAGFTRFNEDFKQHVERLYRSGQHGRPE